MASLLLALGLAAPVASGQSQAPAPSSPGAPAPSQSPSSPAQPGTPSEGQPQYPAPPLNPTPTYTYIDMDTAVLQALDKVTARVSTIDAPVGQTVRFGTLEITVRACRKRPPEEPPESAAFLEIREQKEGEAQPSLLFSGWMFASSPALSTLEHPVYDIIVIDCKNSSKAPSGKSG